jgi:glyoxylase-like metal-dependent hydrolase (beta-lactamase superfamily II)
MTTYEILLPGLPAYGNIGYVSFSCSVLVQSRGLNILIDTGYWPQKERLWARLQELGLTSADINTIVLSHLHLDHFVNVEDFPGAQVLVSAREVEYVRSGEARAKGDYWIPHLLVEELLKSWSVTQLDGRDYNLTDEVCVLATPGHTPGSLSTLIKTDNGPVIHTGDTPKNGWEFLRERVATYGGEAAQADARASIHRQRQLASTFIPSHDRPFRLVDDRLEYLTTLEFEITTALAPENDQGITISFGSRPAGETFLPRKSLSGLTPEQHRAWMSVEGPKF